MTEGCRHQITGRIQRPSTTSRGLLQSDTEYSVIERGSAGIAADMTFY